jgi:hypothetical protein
LVPGTRLDIAIPFEGDPMLWRVRASTFSVSGHPEIDIQQGKIVFTVEFPDDSADSQQLKSQIDRNIRSWADAVGHLKKM